MIRNAVTDRKSLTRFGMMGALARVLLCAAANLRQYEVQFCLAASSPAVPSTEVALRGGLCLLGQTVLLK